ncbi:hypothetical protein ScPMuIL_016852 [Solemya velum]
MDSGSISSRSNQPRVFIFPKRSFGQKNPVQRSVHAAWFGNRTWLHYDESRDLAFCHLSMSLALRGDGDETDVNFNQLLKLRGEDDPKKLDWTSSYSTIIKDVYVVVGDTLTLECEIIPVPERFRGNTTIEMSVDGVSIGSISSSSKLPHSLTNTRDSSSVKNGKFTCNFSDDFLQIFREARYGVREIPDTPHGVAVDCQADQFMATVSWTPGNNLAQVTNFRVEMKTQFSLDEWFLANSTDVSKTSIDLSLNGWVNYTFRVSAQNEATIGAPSESTAAPCVTPQKAPDSNPQDVASIGNQTDYLVVQWEAMPRLLHNGEGFMYKLTYKKVGPSNHERAVLIDDWHTTEKKIQTGDVFTPYEVTVAAMNDLGDSTEAAAKHTLYSSETAPEVSVPLIEIGRVPMGINGVEVEYILKWTKELERSVQMNGVFGGFRIEHWVPYHPEIRRQNDLISKEDLQPVTECDSPADFYLFKVDGLRANLLYQSKFTVRNTYFDGPTTKLHFLTQRREVENLRADCCKRYQRKTNLLWEMHEDRMNPDGIQGKLLGFKLLLSYFYRDEDIVQVNKTVPIATLTREYTIHGLVKFSTVLNELKLDRLYTIKVTPLRERCDWSLTKTAKFTPWSYAIDAAPFVRISLAAMFLALVLCRIRSMTASDLSHFQTRRRAEIGNSEITSRRKGRGQTKTRYKSHQQDRLRPDQCLLLMDLCSSLPINAVEDVSVIPASSSTGQSHDVQTIDITESSETGDAVLRQVDTDTDLESVVVLDAIALKNKSHLSEVPAEVLLGHLEIPSSIWLSPIMRKFLSNYPGTLADTRIPLHVLDIVQESDLKAIDVWFPDTDVLILRIDVAANGHLREHTQLQLQTGKGVKYRTIDVHERVTVMRLGKSRSLDCLHHFTGADGGGKFIGVSEQT